MTNQHSVQIDDTFAEAFPMSATRLILTAYDAELAMIAAQSFCGHASSVIGCNAEAGIERILEPTETPDGRPGISVLAFAMRRADLEKAVVARVGQNVLTCPTTACFSGYESEPEKQIKLGAQLRYFGDGHQIAKKLGERRFWRVPVMDGEFIIDEVAGTTKGIGGGNLIVTGETSSACLAAVRDAVKAIRQLPDVILPFPSGIVRSGSKVGSKYPQLRASTNHQWCPTLRHQSGSHLQAGENVVYEIVIDGLTEDSISAAMQTGIESFRNSAGVTRVSAGNYGGKLGPHHFHLKNLSE